ncbi:vWA domain-containing protein [Nannocystaceae bacterium ST9]
MPTSLLPLLAFALPATLGCAGDDGNSIYGMDEQAEGPTTLDDAASSSSDSDSSDEGIDTDPKLDTLPVDTGVDDGPNEMCDQNVDIVFVMDVSTTMGPFFDKLESEIAVVHEALMQYELPSEPHYGLVVFVDDFTLVNAGTPYTDVDQLKADFAYWNDFTSSNQQTKGGGYNSTWTENSLDAIYAAAAGFQWRPNADTLRMVIHTTDDTFWNGPTTADGVDILHNYPDTVDLLQSKEIRMFSFAALIGGQCDCDPVGMGFFDDFQGQPSIPMQTGGTAYNIDEVLAGVQSLSTAINTAVEDSYCEPYPMTE